MDPIGTRSTELRLQMTLPVAAFATSAYRALTPVGPVAALAAGAPAVTTTIAAKIAEQDATSNLDARTGLRCNVRLAPSRGMCDQYQAPWSHGTSAQLWHGGRLVLKMVVMETIPITEAKTRIAELADRVAREHDHFIITRNGRADVMLISVAEYESMQETLDILSDEQALGDLRQSAKDFQRGDTYTLDEVRAELELRRGKGAR